MAWVVEQLLLMGAYEISLGDTIDAGTPETIRRMLACVVEVVPAEQLAGHFCDTGGVAIRNIESSFDVGIVTFDTSVGELGGCPYALGSTGNVDAVMVEAFLRAVSQGGWTRRGCLRRPSLRKG